jgi:hypothetical protein
MTSRERLASGKLTMALLAAAARGDKIPCGDYSIAYLFTSESEQERKLAAHACQSCPVTAECLQAALANDERHGVWGGHDFTRQPGRTRVA